MMPLAGGRHGRVTHVLGLILGSHVRSRRLGLVYAAETGFVLTRGLCATVNGRAITGNRRNHERS